MSVPTVSWSETTPAGTDDISQGDDRIRELKTQIREVIAVDHDFPSSGQAADVGQHKQVTLQESDGTAQSGSAGIGILVAQTISGKPELVYTDEDDNDVQITGGGVLLAGQLPNNTTFKSKNAAGSGTVDIVKVNTSNQVELTNTTTFMDGLLFEEVSVPTTAADQGALYVKNDGTQTELFFGEESGGDEVQITKGGVLNTALSVVIKSGTANHGDTLTLPTLATGKSSSDYNWAYSVSINTLGTYTGGDGDNLQGVVCSLNTSTLVVTCTGSQRDNGTVTGSVNYLIIGTLK